MPRPPRLDADGAVHHVMNRGVARRTVFFEDVDRIEFGRRLAVIHERFGVETLAYCLLDNHYHLLLRTPTGDLPAAMHHLGLAYTRHTNDRLGRDGPLFRGRYHSILVTTDEYLVWATRYIHRNALDVHGVSDPAAYRWSSYRAYLGRRAAPPFLRTDPVLELFDHDRARLARFTECDDPTDGHGPVRSLADLLQIIDLAVACDDLMYADDQAHRWTARTVLLLVGERLVPGPMRTAVDDHLAFPTYDAGWAARRRARDRLHEPMIRRVLEAVVAQLSDDDPARPYGEYPTLTVGSAGW